MLKELIAQEQADDVKCIALDWECENRHLLTESPGWAKKLPGYLKTIPRRNCYGLPEYVRTKSFRKRRKGSMGIWDGQFRIYAFMERCGDHISK